MLRGRHLGTAPTGTFTEITIQLPELSFSHATDRTSLNELVTQDVEWIAIKPLSLSNDVNFSFNTT